MLDKIISVFFNREVKVNSVKVLREKGESESKDFKIISDVKNYADLLCEKILKNAKVTDGVIYDFVLNRNDIYKRLFNACMKR